MEALLGLLGAVALVALWHRDLIADLWWAAGELGG